MDPKPEKFKLKPSQFRTLEKEFPGPDPHSIGKRAVKIIKFYFLRKNPKEKFVIPKKNTGLDLEVCSKNLIIEIKGTIGSDIGWAKLKVSGKPCYKQLEKGAPIYRVTNVLDREIDIYIIKCKENFKIVPEPRYRLVKL